MEIRTDPPSLRVKDANSIICPCCQNTLTYEIVRKRYFIECGLCIYSDRPFGGLSPQLGECDCKWSESEKDFLYIRCFHCKTTTCKKCKKPLACDNEKCGSVVCSDCVEKQGFNRLWKTKTPQEKLEFYGMTKLKVLAKIKNVQGYSKYKKHELITSLSPLVTDDDFPIKKT